MKNLIKTIVFALAACGLLLIAAPAFAASPYLTVTSEGGTLVQLTVSNANPYSQITLYRQQNSTLWTVINNIGSTDGNGYFSQSMSLGSDGSNNPVNQYVVVAGLQSPTVTTYPNGGTNCLYNGYNNCSGSNCGYNNGYYNTNCGGSGSLTLSQTSLSLSAGQTSVVTAYSNSGSLYVSNNSNSSVATYTISGTQLNIYGSSAGSTTMNVCSNNGCTSLFVTVSGNNNCYTNCGNGYLTLNQSSVSLNAGQTVTVTANNNYYNSSYNSIYVTNNNTGIVSSSVNGNTISLYGISNGSVTLSVCANGSSQCASLYVTVTGNGYNNGTITFSPSTVNLSTGQTTTVYVYNSNSYNNFYISNNSSSGIVSATLSGTAITLYGQNSGSSTITVCQNSTSQCGSLYVTVNGNNGYYGNGSVSLSQSSVSLNSGQTSYITVSGNQPFQITTNSNSAVASVSVSGNSVIVYGSSYGSTTATICSGYNSYNNYGNTSGCATLYVTVNGNGYNNNNNYNNNGSIYLSSTNLPVANAGQYYNYQLQATGGTAPYNYYVTSGSLPPGLYLSNSGLISGTVQGYSSYNTVTVQMTDLYGRTGTGQLSFNGGQSVLGASTYSNGQLINTNGTVYIVYKNTKIAFGNAAAFTGLGFNFSNVVNTGYDNLSISGYVVSTARGPHPWGSWVKSGSTVYFVQELGLIPVPDYNTFINNGGQDSLVVKANSWDFQLPILSPMTYSDARLR